MRTQTKYIAFDGTEFDSEDDCRFHEGSIAKATPELKIRIANCDTPVGLSAITVAINGIGRAPSGKDFAYVSVTFIDEKGNPVIELPTQGRRLYIGDTITVAEIAKATELKLVW